MPISLKNLIGPGQSIEIGECVMMQDQPEPIIELDGMTFLKSGYVLADEEESYPEAYERFGGLERDLNQWIPVSMTTNSIYAVAYANGAWILAGHFGMYRSLDGLTWVHQWSGKTMKHVEYANDMWLAVGGSGTILTSEDGLVWIERESPISAHINHVKFGDGLWIAVADDGDMISSNDGVVWQTVSSGVTYKLNRIGYGNGRWLAIGISNQIITSLDGVTWNTLSYTFPSSFAYGLAYTNDLWLVGGFSGALITSTDGVNWENRVSSFGNDSIHAIAYSQGVYILGGSGRRIATSSDGVTWTQRNGKTSGIIEALGTGKGDWIAAGQLGYLAINTPTPTLGLQTLTQVGQSTQYMRIK